MGIKLLRDVQKSDLEIACSVCNKPALKLTLIRGGLIVHGENFAYAVHLPKSKKLLIQARNGDYLPLEEAIKTARREGLEGYCNTCKKFYCNEHAPVNKEFEEGWGYDYSFMTCPLGHTKIIDD